MSKVVIDFSILAPVFNKLSFQLTLWVVMTLLFSSIIVGLLKFLKVPNAVGRPIAGLGTLYIAYLSFRFIVFVSESL